MPDFLVLSSVLLALTWICVIRPVRAAQQHAALKRFNDEFERFQLRTVQRLYPELQNLSMNEIKRSYNFRAAYNDLQVLRNEEGLALPWIH